MRRLLLALMLSLLSSAAMLAEDITVLGIPLKGSIENFTAKLKQQGCRVSPESKALPIGQRAYEVRFAGEDALLLVSYDVNTKNVYDAVLTFSSFQQESLKSKYELFKTNVDKKYAFKPGNKVSAQIDRFRGMPMWRFTIENKTELIGKIYIYYWDIPADGEYNTIYQLNIRYRRGDAPSFEDESLKLF